MFLSSDFEKKANQLGDFLDYNRDGRKIELHFENGVCEVIVYLEDVIRIRISDRELEEDLSYAVEKPVEEFEYPYTRVQNETNKITINTPRIGLEIQKSPIKLSFHDKNDYFFLEDESGYSFCRDEKGSIRTYKKMGSGEHFYGFGEKTGPLDKRGESMEMWAGDRGYKNEEDPLYVSIPFFIGVEEGKAYGVFFDNTYHSYFDMGDSSEETFSFGADEGELRYYVIWGPEIPHVLERYTELTGRMKLPPKWSLGYHQSRWSYTPEDKVLEVAENFRKKDIPCDAIHLDIDYMDGYRVFTFDEEKFPDPEGMINQLDDWGFSTVVIVDPGIKEDEEFGVYKECIENGYYCRNPEDEPAKSWMWPGICVFPDFTRSDVRGWWGDLHQFYFEKGVDGIWNDMNEPSTSFFLDKWDDFLPLSRAILENFYLYDFGRNSTMKRVRNVYGLTENIGANKGFEKHLPDKRPFVLTRSGYAGVQKYAAIWTGDNWSAFHQIPLSVRMIMNLGLSGVAFAGADIGGFSGIAKYLYQDPELYKRWIQTGVFYPFSRSHTAKSTKPQEPWSFGPEVEEVSRRYISLRYKLLPYLYTLFWKASQLGHPVFRPLFFNYQDDEMCYDERFENQFMLGEDLLVVPVSERNVESLNVYLPDEPYWTDFWEGQDFEGGGIHTLERSLLDIPVFVRSGAILPMYPIIQNTKEDVEKLNIHVYPGEGFFKLYEDDGKTKEYNQGKYATINFDLNSYESSLELSIDKEENGFKLPYQNYGFEIHSDQDVENILVDGKEKYWNYDELDKKITFETRKTDIRKIEILF